MLCPNCFSATWDNTICTTCHYCEDDKSRDDFYLPVRHLLFHNQYRVGRVLGSPGGFGITYLAWDTRLETKVAIKEYLPRHLASRGNSALVRPHTQGDAVDFKFGMEQFLNEAKILARMKHSNIIRILTYFEENGTAYLVMDYLEGESLGEYLTRVGKLTAPDGIQLMLPIIDGLSHIHLQGFIHRDVKPSNIYLTKEGHTILLDFGAARQALQEKSQSMTSILTPGYAPWEQYHRKGNQGPWTDVYACAAVIYQMLTGQLPVDSQERLAEDFLVSPSDLNPSIPTSVSKVILHALSLHPTERPQSADAFSRELQASIMLNRIDSVQGLSSSAIFPANAIVYQKASDKNDISPTASADLVKEFYWEAEKERSSPSRLIVVCAVVAILVVAGFGGYQYYERSNASSSATSIQAVVLSPQNTPSSVQTSDTKPAPATTPPPAAPEKPLTLQDGKISPFPYKIRDKVTREQILKRDLGLGPLLSSERERFQFGRVGTSGWGREYRFRGITVSTEHWKDGDSPPIEPYSETVWSIVLVDSTYETSRGIKVGMSKQEIINRYGPWPNIWPNTRNKDRIVYPIVKQMDDVTLRFDINTAGIITRISVAYPLN